ncbi:MAG: hypothetical protein IAG13_21780 [Deltaproteobacteria bacterium]|nr:hypothetical protein [Nannocystaceae bacterium]
MASLTTTPGSEGETGTQPTTGATDGSTSESPETTAVAEGPKWDVGGAVDPGDCEKSPAGIFCKEGVALECDGAGGVVSSETCLPDICVEGEGCVECLDNQYHCSGPRVMTCNADADPPRWVEIDVCDPTIGEGCDQELGACEILQVLGDNVVTGSYYQYANFSTSGTPYLGGFDVDSYDNRIYVTDFAGTRVDIYEVQLLDSDGDGSLEPNQHPDNPDEPGPIEERTIEFIESISPVEVFNTGLIASEIFATDDRMWVGGASIREYVFGSPGSSVVTTAPNWVYPGLGCFSMIGRDEVSGVWYAANEFGRRVLQHDAETDTWGIAFLFPDLAGSHMDGLEIVTDPNTGTPYVYVSDMTSDYIGQYRLDDELGWVHENLFQYSGTAGESVEGMGFGALNHFWITGYAALYEIGGGDLAVYTEPTPVG